MIQLKATKALTAKQTDVKKKKTSLVSPTDVSWLLLHSCLWGRRGVVKVWLRLASLSRGPLGGVASSLKLLIGMQVRAAWFGASESGSGKTPPSCTPSSLQCCCCWLYYFSITSKEVQLRFCVIFSPNNRVSNNSPIVYDFNCSAAVNGV